MVRKRVLAFTYEVSNDLQEIGMRALARFPTRDALDRLWNLHCVNEEARAVCSEQQDRGALLFRREVTMTALRSCLETDLNLARYQA